MPTTRTALLVVDTQVGVFAEVHDRAGVLDAVRATVDRARAAGAPVVWVQDVGEDRRHGSPTWQVVPELEPEVTEVRVDKSYGDAFEATDLELILRDAGVGRVVVVGGQTDACVRATIHGAFVRGYDTVLVADAHTTEDLTAWGNPPPEQVIAHTNLYWQYQSAPGRTASVVRSDEVTFD